MAERSSPGQRAGASIIAEAFAPRAQGGKAIVGEMRAFRALQVSAFCAPSSRPDLPRARARSGLVGLAGQYLGGRLQIALFNEYLCSTRKRKREGPAGVIATTHAAIPAEASSP